jgi:hypothetical protein
VLVLSSCTQNSSQVNLLASVRGGGYGEEEAQTTKKSKQTNKYEIEHRKRVTFSMSEANLVVGAQSF